MPLARDVTGLIGLEQFGDDAHSPRADAVHQVKAKNAGPFLRSESD